MRLLALLLSLPALSASGADWVPIANHAREKLELDRGSIVRQGDWGTAWDRTTYEPGRSPSAAGDVEFRVARTLVRYDCARRTVVPVVRSFSQSEGPEILRQNVEGAELPQPVVPDTPRDRMLDMVCKVKPPPERSIAAKPAVPVGQPLPVASAKAAAPAGAKPEAAKEDKAGAEPTKAADKGQGEKPAEPKAANAKAPEGKEAPPKTADAKAPEGKGADAKGARPEQAGSDKAAEGQKKEDPKSAAAGHKPVEGKGAPPGHEALAGKKPATAPGHGKPGDKAAEAKPADEHAGAEKEGHDKKKVHWSYTGNNGVQQWHKLSPEFAACAEGKRQSPIDIRDGVRSQLEPIVFNYKPSGLRVVNNGHTIEVKYEPGSSITIGETTYALIQFHFHRPAEERVNGRAFDMVAHLVHKSTEGKLAVVAVLMMTGDENAFIKTLWNNLPLDVDMEERLESVKIDASQLLPKIRGYYTYMGSLTTPPCTEGVRWIVMRTPVQISRSQVQTFSRVYEMNARPVQAANGRLVKEVL